MKIKLPFAALALATVFAFSMIAAPVYAVVEDDSMTYEEKQQYIEEYKNKAAERKQELKEQAAQKAAEIKKQAEERAKEAKEEADQKRLEARQQLCEKNASKLSGTITKKAQTAQGFYERFSGFSDKVDRFIEAKQLVPQDYEALVEAVEDSANNVEAAIEKLEALKDFEVDCTEVDLTKENAQAYRDAVVEVKDALKVYKTALVNYLRAVVTSYNASQAKIEDSSSESTDATDDSGDTTADNSGDANTNDGTNDSADTNESTEGVSDVQ